MKKLYRIGVKFAGQEDVLVLANNAGEAALHALEDVDPDHALVHVYAASQVETLDDVPVDWRDCEPVDYDSDNSLTCAEWLLQAEQCRQQQQKREQEQKPDPRQLPLKIQKEDQ